MEVELFDAFTSNDDEIIGRKESLVFDQNMAYQTFNPISGDSVAEFFAHRQANTKVWLVFVQAVNHEFPVGNILATFKNSIEILVTFDAIALFQTSTPSFKFILLYHIFKKSQSHSGDRLLFENRKEKGKGVIEIEQDVTQHRIEEASTPVIKEAKNQAGNKVDDAGS